MEEMILSMILHLSVRNNKMEVQVAVIFFLHENWISSRMGESVIRFDKANYFHCFKVPLLLILFSWILTC